MHTDTYNIYIVYTSIVLSLRIGSDKMYATKDHTDWRFPSYWKWTTNNYFDSKIFLMNRKKLTPLFILMIGGFQRSKIIKVKVPPNSIIDKGFC